LICESKVAVNLFLHTLMGAGLAYYPFLSDLRGNYPFDVPVLGIKLEAFR
jgi:hypothetical protein